MKRFFSLFWPPIMVLIGTVADVFSTDDAVIGANVLCFGGLCALFLLATHSGPRMEKLRQ
jgi:hypothetical protein